MTNNFFDVLRPGIHTTYQDKGRANLYHVGIPFSGVMDNRNFLILNALLNNETNIVALEFAYQGPLLKFNGESAIIAITGDVSFEILRNGNKSEVGNCYKTYLVEKNDQINIISTNKSVYGYFGVHGGFKTNSFQDSYSTYTIAKVGGNNGEKLKFDQKIFMEKDHNQFFSRSIDFSNSKIEKIRVIKGPNFDFFSDDSKKKFFLKYFNVTKLTDRMGMRLSGEKLENIKQTNIKSEGLNKGVIQVPADGNPIIMLSDHGTIGGYPKIAVVISCDYDKLVQLIPGAKVKFELVDLNQAENLFKLYELETKKIISNLK